MWRLPNCSLQAGANTDLQVENGNTALIYTAEHGHAEIARLLLEAGADKNLQGDDGHTALFRAMERGLVSDGYYYT